MTLDIVKIPHPRLSAMSIPVTEFGTALQRLTALMLETLERNDGLGLAAPQVDVGERIIVVKVPHDPSGENKNGVQPKQCILINPMYLYCSKTKSWDFEACLSIPGVVGEVERHNRIEVSGFDPFGKPIQIKADGLYARVIQHEIDHLDGKLFTSKCKNIHLVNVT